MKLLFCLIFLALSLLAVADIDKLSLPQAVQASNISDTYEKTQNETLKLSNSQTLKLSNSQTLKLSNSQTLKLDFLALTGR